MAKRKKKRKVAPIREDKKRKRNAVAARRRDNTVNALVATYFQLTEPGLYVTTRKKQPEQEKISTHLATKIPLAYRSFQTVKRVTSCEDRRAKSRRAFFGAGRPTGSGTTNRFTVRC